MGFALASLGFGLFRPGFTSGASLAVAPHEQNAVAGMVTSVNGVAFIAAPAAGVLLYGLAGYTNLSAEGTGVELDGWRLGAGVEVALSEPGRAEGRGHAAAEHVGQAAAASLVEQDEEGQQETRDAEKHLQDELEDLHSR